MRPARPDEVPKFGSVWQWANATSDRFVVLWLNGDILVSLKLPHAEVDQFMFWRILSSGTTLPGWKCLDEGPE